jgi:hypothetical protein
MCVCRKGRNGYNQLQLLPKIKHVKSPRVGGILHAIKPFLKIYRLLRQAQHKSRQTTHNLKNS